jgi:uncharacterized protein YjbI with pentapeptide repeats
MQRDARFGQQIRWFSNSGEKQNANDRKVLGLDASENSIRLVTMTPHIVLRSAFAAVLLAAAGGPSGDARAQSDNCRITRAAKCEKANLEGRDLRGANLRDANMKGAKLRGANLTGADLGGADFSEADMRFSNLGGTALYGTKFVNTDMTGAGLRFQDIKADTDLSGATMPDGKRCSSPSLGDCKNPSAAPPAPQRR